MNRRYGRGFTLIEVIIFMVVVSIGLAGILLVSTTVVKSSADPMVRKQTLAIAEALLEEILLKEFCDPDTVNRGTSPPTCGTHTTEASRNLYDDVFDYNNYSTSGGIVGIDGVAIPSLASYNISPAVTVVNTTDLTGIAQADAVVITVTVTGPGGPISLVGYKANY